MAIASRSLLSVGDVAPWFQVPLLSGAPDFQFDKLGGHYNLLLFFGSAALPACAAALRLAAERRHLFDDVRCAMFGVTIDQTDASTGRIAFSGPGLHYFLDYDRRISALYGAAVEVDGAAAYRPHWLLLDPALRVAGRYPLDRGGDALDALERLLGEALPDTPAPVLILPNVLEPEYRARLIGLYEQHGGAESGFMRQVGDKTVGTHDYKYKRRRDYMIEDEAVREELRVRLRARLLPMIARSFQYQVTRIERYIVACYDGETGGHFAAHRDNTTVGTAHRRFAVTINLNGDFDGGELRFPEFGPRTYRAPPGGAVVFSCTLLHEAMPVTAGKRYATLPFLYDDEDARVREANSAAIVSRPRLDQGQVEASG